MEFGTGYPGYGITCLLFGATNLCVRKDAYSRKEWTSVAVVKLFYMVCACTCSVRLDQILNVIGIVFVAWEILFGIIVILSFLRSVKY